ncbi:hypothetical protein E1B28_010645 [Marasmius oreades]|uniref:Uncharacterized protein n=1 Tax=Marasmius oreades TaxID=181124 RepID=A0A9P7RYR3_9AGAR|nr:uncharacterized protein E1B28_010645 [Marasmius oreades]KAG7091626.1 hypothetical protein E1B28_010645 [Marasmius oreades]
MASLEEILKPWFTNEVMIVQPVVSLTVTWFVYGFYIGLFIVTLHNLYKHHPANHKLYLTWTILLFFLCTLNNIIETWYRVRQAIKIYTGEHTKDYPPLLSYAQHDTIKTIQRGFLMILPIIANLTAETMLIHRCYLVWFKNKWVATTLIFLSLALNTVGLAGCIMFTKGFSNTSINPKNVNLLLKGNSINNGYLIANAVFNGLLTALTAGRIYLISREARKHLDAKLHSTYRTVVAIIIESGLLYPASLIIYIVILLKLDPDNQSLLPVDLSPLFMQAAGIAPTLIIVRALQGKTTDSVDQVVSANNHRTNTEPISTTKSGIRFVGAGGPRARAGGGGGATTIHTITTDLGEISDEFHHTVDLPNGNHSSSGGSLSGSDLEKERQQKEGVLVTPAEV